MKSRTGCNYVRFLPPQTDSCALGSYFTRSPDGPDHPMKQKPPKSGGFVFLFAEFYLGFEVPAVLPESVLPESVVEVFFLCFL